MQKIFNTSVGFYVICLLFIVFNTIALADDEIGLTALPFALAALFLVFFNLEKMLLLLCFIVPLSVHFDDVGMGLGISLPDEPLIMLIMGLAVFKFIIHSEYDYQIFKHPVSIAIIINITWVFITSITSQMPLVSFKFFLSRFWYIVVFYFLGVALFKNFSNIPRYMWLYAIPLAGVIVYTIIKHSAFGFSKDGSYDVSYPFYEAHGVYSAAIAYLIPFIALYVFVPRSLKVNPVLWVIALVLLCLFSAGLILSYTRAAWLSVAVAVAAIVPLLLRIRLNTIILLIAVGGSFFLLFQNQIYDTMSRTQDVSSDDMSMHLKSVSNIKSDASNTERINRWMCAWTMFKEHPVTGVGPGAYMFLYAPYQLWKYHTEISTNFGDVGNAHSEYFGPLSESGLIGMLSVLAIIYYALSTAFKLFYHSPKRKVRMAALGIMLGFITYVVHGIMNNYSDSDKIAVLWWGSLAMITALDIYHSKLKKD